MFDLEQVAARARATSRRCSTDPHTPRLARRVFVVIVDGLRLDKSYELPFLDELRRRGVDTEAHLALPDVVAPELRVDPDRRAAERRAACARTITRRRSRSIR